MLGKRRGNEEAEERELLTSAKVNSEKEFHESFSTMSDQNLKNLCRRHNKHRIFKSQLGFVLRFTTTVIVGGFEFYCHLFSDCRHSNLAQPISFLSDFLFIFF